MKKNYIYALFFSLLSSLMWAQTTETFETETNNATSFTDNSQVFNITSQAPGNFIIQGGFAGTGWNGTAADNKYIDNSGTAFTNTLVTFTVSSAGAVPFKVNSMWLYLANASANVNVTGSLTIVGKLAGVTKFTATASSGFNTNVGVTNGFSLINMTTFGGSNNSTTAIDQFVISTGGNFFYVALDALTWTTIPALTATTSQTNIACNGGSTGKASVTAAGGSSPYTYSWAPSGGTGALATGLSAGSYTCTITDASLASITKVFTLTQPPAIVTSTAVTNELCNGGSTGSATITASGGTGAYTYLWSTGATTSVITSQVVGVKTVTVTDANSCTSIKNVTITQPSALVTSTAVTNVACNGGSNGVASITASGGAGSYTYLWSNGGTTSAITGLLAGAYSATVTDANSCTSTKGAIVTQPSALVTSTAITNVACNGGSNGVASITASGGAGGYTYLWSNGGTTSAITGLLAGAYSATVTDANSCTSTKGAIVTQPSALVTSTAVTNVACNGGSNGVASITASGGAGGYTYLWNTGATTSAITGQVVGVKTATVTDANSCTSIKNVTITQPSAIVTSTAVTNVACNGGSNGVASITASGGAGGYTYLWSNGATTSAITGLLAGTYSATVTDANSCTSIKSAIVTQPSALVTSTAVTNVACNGGSNGVASITASGGVGGYTYLWSNGGTTSAITGLLAGAYSATVTDANSCTSTKGATVTQPSALVSTTAVTNVSCNGGSNGSTSVSVSGGTGSYTYAWAPSGGTGATASGLSAGAYMCTITDANSCTATKTVAITQPSAISVVPVSQTNIACNGGSNGAASISTPTGGAGGYTYNWTPGNPTGDGTISVTGLTAGSWTCTVTDANACTKAQTFNVTQPTALAASTSQTNVSCNGGYNGSTSVSVSGGTTSYSYAWSPSGGTVATASGLTAGTYTCTITDANSCSLTKAFTVTQPTVLNVTSTSASTICSGNSTTLSASATGGTGAITYTWNPGNITTATSIVSPTTSTNYTVTCMDANTCTASITTSLTVNALPTISVNSGSICAGQSFTMTPSGASTYTYSSGSAVVTPTTNTSYNVTGTDANGCISSSAAVSSVTVNALPTISVNSGAICIGNSFTMTPSGASTYTYSSGSAIVTPTTNTSYNVTGTDANGCISSSAAVSSVTVNALPTISVNSGAICTGNSFTMTPSGANTYTYSSGSAIVTPTINASYNVTGTDANGCISSSAAVSSVTVNALPMIMATTNSTLLCVGQTASLTASGATSYTWNTSATTAAIAVSPTTTVTYTVNGTDANGCSNVATVTQNVNTCTDIQSVSNQPSLISVYPNPTGGLINVELEIVSGNNASIQILNTLGEVLVNESVNTQHPVFNIQHFTAGVYFVKVIQQGKQQIIKLIKD
jgi:hypothetical protein